MAKTKINPKPTTSSSYLCCFGIPSSSSSVSHRTPIKGSNIIGSDEQKIMMSNSRRFPWKNMFRFRVKSKSRKTVPVDQSSSEYEEEKEKVMKLIRSKKGNKANNKKVMFKYQSSKLRISKSNMHNKTSQTNIVLAPTPPSQTQLVLSHLSPNPTPIQLQMSNQNSENHNVVNNTCQKSSSSPTRPAAATTHAVSVRTSKRQVRRRLLSSLQPKTTQKQPKKHQNAKKPYNGVVGAYMVMVTLVIMILWGRFCAIVCTSMCLYFVPRFRLMDGENDVVENDGGINNDSKDLDLDSVVYKKKVVLEGLLQRKHSGCKY